MNSGWFSAFREDFAPTSYGTLTNPCINVRTIIVFLVFVIPYLAFLIVFPGLREKRIVSFTTITVHMSVGVLLIGALVLPYWRVGDAVVLSQFKSHSMSRHESKVGIRIGLNAINVTLKYIRSVDEHTTVYDGLYFNERYSLEGVRTMAEELMDAYYDGLPYPMLKLLEYFSLSQGAFAWGKQFRNAGHFASALVWTSFITWIWQCLLLAFLPHHYAKLGVLCGLIALTADIVYVFLSPNGPNIPFTSPTQKTTYLSLYYGSAFYMCMVAGLLSLAYGIMLSILQYMRIYTLSTCLSSALDPNVGPKCRYGRVYDAAANETSQSSSCSEVSTNYMNDESSNGKKLEVVRQHHNKHLATAKSGNKSKISPTQTGNSSGFQSGSSLRSSTNSTISSLSTSGGIQRTLSTDTIGHSNLTDDDDPPTANRSPALSSIAEHHFAHSF